MTTKEIKLLIWVATICSEGRGQEGQKLQELAEQVEFEDQIGREAMEDGE